MRDDPSSEKANATPLPVREQEVVEDHLPLRSPMVYEVVRQEGESELSRPLGSLWWSGLAAGIAIVASVIGEGALHGLLPEVEWRPALESFGYCLGFLIVILGRLQLFTENTITAVLPLLANWSGADLLKTARLWGVVLLANVCGTVLTAALIVHAGLVPAALLPELTHVSAQFAAHPPLEALMLGLPAGFLIAAIVWMLPNAEGSEFAVIVTLTWLIALGGFTHVVVGSAELAILAMQGELGLGGASALFAATLVGNVVGGTGLFALLAYAQVREEM